MLLSNSKESPAFRRGESQASRASLRFRFHAMEDCVLEDNKYCCGSDPELPCFRPAIVF